MKDVLDRWGKTLKDKIAMAVGRCILRLVDDSGPFQLVQVDVLAGETIDGLEHFQPFGFSSRAKPGSEGIILAVAGRRGNSIVLVIADPDSRPTGLLEGESVLHDAFAQKIYLSKDRIDIVTPKDVRVTCANAIVNASVEVDVTAPKVVVTSNDIELGDAGGPAVARVGDHVVGGVITTGSAKVTAA